MERYKNLSGNSGVARFGIGPDSIAVEFNGGDTYLYDHEVPGKVHVERMKRLAKEGAGLSGYIAKHVRERYSRQIR
jgi:hypothetical protein